MPLNHNYGPFSRKFSAPPRTEGEPPSNRWSRYSLPQGTPCQPHRPAMWLERLRARTGKQSRRATPGSSRTELKNHQKITPTPANALRPRSSPTTQTSPPKAPISNFPCNPLQELVKRVGKRTRNSFKRGVVVVEWSAKRIHPPSPSSLLCFPRPKLLGAPSEDRRKKKKTLKSKRSTPFYLA